MSKTKAQAGSKAAIREEGKVLKIETIDGVKAWIDDYTWVLIRASGTEPIIRVYAEAKKEERAEEIAEAYRGKVAQIIKSLGG